MEGILGRRTMKKLLFMLLLISAKFCIAQEASCHIPVKLDMTVWHSLSSAPKDGTIVDVLEYRPSGKWKISPFSWTTTIFFSKGHTAQAEPAWRASDHSESLSSGECIYWTPQSTKRRTP
jgi:hypothetical protein